MKFRRAATVALVTVSIGLMTTGCSSDLAEIPGGAGSQGATLPATPTATAPAGSDSDSDVDLAACIAQSGFISRPVAEPMTDQGELSDEEIAELEAKAKQLLEDQLRYDTVLAQCHQGEGEPSPTPTP
jgi:hypothetical protein